MYRAPRCSEEFILNKGKDDSAVSVHLVSAVKACATRHLM